MEIKILRLSTGEDVIGQIQNQSGEITEIKKAFVIIPTQSAPGKPVQLMLTPYLPYATEDVIKIKREHIIAEVSPKTDIKNSYNYHLGTGIIQPRKPELITETELPKIDKWWMIEIYFVRDGSKIRVEVPPGFSIMEAATKFSSVPIPEIPADCGGNCACATCHVYVDNLPIVENSLEQELLEYEKGYDPKRSRLGCQIMLGKEHDKLIVELRDKDDI